MSEAFDKLLRRRASKANDRPPAEDELYPAQSRVSHDGPGASITRGAESDTDVVVSLSDVAVEFEDPDASTMTQVLDKLSIQVYKGEFLVIVGRSGCGKTTVLNVLIGFVLPSRGEVIVLGTSPRVARGRVGYMFANDALLPWRRALASVELGLEFKGVPKKERREISRRRLASLGLGDKGHLFPSQLSRGMRQRVALARTWVTDPELLLMDEPFGALDADTRASVQREFLDMWVQQQQTVVFVTHDLTEAIIMADRIIVMGAGGRIRDEVPVPFPRPRTTVELSESAEYQRLFRRLNDAIGNDD